MIKKISFFALVFIAGTGLTLKAQQPIQMSTPTSRAYIPVPDKSGPVHWAFSMKKTGPHEALLKMTANMDKGWHIYSQKGQPGGPLKTSFTFQPSKDYTLVGLPAEPKPVTARDSAFRMDHSAYFENSVTFTQKVRLTGTQATVKGKLEYMGAKGKQILPPNEINFNVPVK